MNNGAKAHTEAAPSLLACAIQQLSSDPMTVGDAQDAARNLVGFFELLLDINHEQQQADSARE